jgi:hypothetical protein
MQRLRRILVRWIPVAGVATALCALAYFSVQQVWRQSANDPQIQIARDGARMLGNGAAVESVVPSTAVDISESLAPFVAVFDDSGTVVASSGRLHGQARTPPAGVLANVRTSGEERVTWQPEPGIRIASVTVRYSGAHSGFVLAGRSLRESERRTKQFSTLVGIAWIATLVGLLVLVAASDAIFAD